MSRILVSAALALAMSAAALAPALADDEGPGWMMGGGGCPMMGMMGRGGWPDGARGPGMMHRMPRIGALVEGRLAYLKGELDITGAEAAAWDGYAKAVRERVERMQDVRQQMGEAMHKGTAGERIDARIAALQTMLDSLKAVKPALEALYSVLSDEQKQTADDLIGAGCGGM